MPTMVSVSATTEDSVPSLTQRKLLSTSNSTEGLISSSQETREQELYKDNATNMLGVQLASSEEVEKTRKNASSGHNEEKVSETKTSVRFEDEVSSDEEERSNTEGGIKTVWLSCIERKERVNCCECDAYLDALALNERRIKDKKRDECPKRYRCSVKREFQVINDIVQGLSDDSGSESESDSSKDNDETDYSIDAKNESHVNQKVVSPTNSDSVDPKNDVQSTQEPGTLDNKEDLKKSEASSTVSSPSTTVQSGRKKRRAVKEGASASYAVPGSNEFKKKNRAMRLMDDGKNSDDENNGDSTSFKRKKRPSKKSLQTEALRNLYHDNSDKSIAFQVSNKSSIDVANVPTTKGQKVHWSFNSYEDPSSSERKKPTRRASGSSTRENKVSKGSAARKPLLCSKEGSKDILLKENRHLKQKYEHAYNYWTNENKALRDMLHRAQSDSVELRIQFEKLKHQLSLFTDGDESCSFLELPPPPSPESLGILPSKTTRTNTARKTRKKPISNKADRQASKAQWNRSPPSSTAFSTSRNTLPNVNNAVLNSSHRHGAYTSNHDQHFAERATEHVNRPTFSQISADVPFAALPPSRPQALVFHSETTGTSMPSISPPRAISHNAEDDYDPDYYNSMFPPESNNCATQDGPSNKHQYKCHLGGPVSPQTRDIFLVEHTSHADHLTGPAPANEKVQYEESNCEPGLAKAMAHMTNLPTIPPPDDSLDPVPLMQQ